MTELIGIVLLAATVLPSMHAASSTSLDISENLNCAWVAEQMEWPLGDEAIVFAMKKGPAGSIFTDLRANGVSTNILRKLQDDIANSSDANSVMGLAAVVEIAAQRNKIKAEAMANADIALKDALAGLQQRAVTKELQVIEKREGRAGAALAAGLLAVPLVCVPMVVGGVLLAPICSLAGCAMVFGAPFVTTSAIVGPIISVDKNKYNKKIAAIKQQIAIQRTTVEVFQESLNNLSYDLPTLQ